MSQRLVFLIDADDNLNRHLVGELGRYGFRVEAAIDSNELMQRKDDLPSLIVLCIDPKRTGWAVCNRLRKSMTLKSTPLIITSAEATEKDFEDHKKLKTRAEEYLHKPFGVEALVEKIGGLIGMPDPAQALEIPMESEELALDDGSIIEEEADDGALYDRAQGQAIPSFEDAAEEEDRTRIGVMNVDGEVDVETEAAFAAIGAEGLEESTNIMPVEELKQMLPRMPPPKRPAVAEVPLDEPFGEDDDPFALPRHAGPSVPAPLPPAESQPIQTHHFGTERSSEPLDLGLEDVARQAAAEPVRQRVASQPRIAPAAVAVPAGLADTQAHDTNAAAAAELKRERDQLKREVEELQRKLAQKPADAGAPAVGSGFSREREFLNLRETINKKEREVLDLKDAVGAKERLILDGSTKLRELERKARDLDEKSLETERELVAAKEKIEALAHDKERSVERERQVKARLEDALKTSSRYEQEIESWKQKHAADVEAAEQTYNDAVAAHQAEAQALRAQHQQALEEQQAEHGERLQKAADAHAEDKALLGAKHEEERARMESEAATALERLRETSQNERDGLRLRFEQQIAESAQQHDSEKQGLREEHAGAVAQLKDEHAAAIVEKEQLHADEIAGLRARQAKELEAADKRRLDELAQKVDEHRVELEALAADHVSDRQRMEQDHIAALHALDERRQSELREAAEAHAGELGRTRQELEQRLADELKNARDQHMRKMQALEESHADLKAGMQQRHTQQLEELKNEQAGVVAEYDAAIAQRDQLITEGHDRVAELEQQVAAKDEEAQKRDARIGELEQRLKTALEDLSAREATLNDRAQRIADLEQESAGYQDQILKAYQRIKSDESIVSRAKKALAIALTLLDESAPDGADEASS